MVGVVITGMELLIRAVWLILKGGTHVGVHVQLLKH